jgi:hypothetical protein
MGKTVILSEQTVRDLLEAYASLSAWYYQLWSALQRANGHCEQPSLEAGSAFLRRLAQDYPELAAVAQSIPAPRPFVPPPVALSAVPPPIAPAALDRSAEEPETIVEPATARVRTSDPAPPPFVPPGSVRYR